MGDGSTRAFGLRVGVAAAAVLAAVLGAAGFVQYLPTRTEFAGATEWDIAYYTLQLFVLDPGPLDVPRHYPVTLEVARFLAPATTILAVVETIRVLLRDRIRQWTIAHSRNHIVVAGNDPVALLLTRRFVEDGERVALISTTPGENIGDRRDVFVVVGDPTQEPTLRAAGAHRAATVYACGQDSATNLVVALTAHRMAVRPVSVQAEMRDVALFTALRTARRTDDGAAGGLRFWLNFFVVEDLAARALLSEESQVAGHDDTGPVVVLGDTTFGTALRRQLARRGVKAALVPEQDATAWAPGNEAPSTRVYVCLADTDTALRVALTHARGGCSRVVLCVRQHSALADALSGALFDNAGGRLVVFGILDAACDAAPRDHLDELGRALHEHYVRTCRARGDTVAANPSLVPWDRLPEHLKQSNRAQADHVGAKLASIGCAIVPAMPGGEPFDFRAGEVERLAELEHQRWVTERQAAGFIHGPVRQGRFHPDLVDWEYLSEEGRNKDIEFVRHIPDLLQDAGFQVLRL
ncbi:MAG TPA: NAD-binding protein [Pseudonocardiaceae bacterium]